MNIGASLPGAFAPPTAGELAEIARMMRDGAGIVIAEGKSSMVQSRLAKRLRALGLRDYQAYLDYVKCPEGSAEFSRMLSALTTNVTQFFRENHHFEQLRAEVLPPLIARARAGGQVRIWSAGCSSGQEPYSIAMVLCDLAENAASLDIRILATDIDPEMTALGRAARYEQASADSVPAPLARKFLRHARGQVEIADPPRSLVSFRELNLHANWPMRGPFDVIFCRNVAIYFDKPAQDALWQRFETALAPGGWLFLGHSERLSAERPTRLASAGITSYRLPKAGPDQGDRTWR